MKYEKKLKEHPVIRIRKWIQQLNIMHKEYAKYGESSNKYGYCRLCEISSFRNEATECNKCPWSIFHPKLENGMYYCFDWAYKYQSRDPNNDFTYPLTFKDPKVVTKRKPQIKRWIKILEEHLEGRK